MCKPISDEEFMRRGMTCPFCGSEDVGEDPDSYIDECHPVLGDVCNDCGARWREKHQTVGYDVVEGPRC